MNLLIDGSSLLWRTHHANKSADLNADIYIFLKSLRSYANTYNSKDIYIAWDKKLNRELNFRQLESDGEYKGNRDDSNKDAVYRNQETIHEMTTLLGCKNFYPWNMEADDIIAWLSTYLEGQNLIITTDQDMLQLVTPKTCLFHPRKNMIIDHKNFESVMEMPIEYFLPYKAILGDKSDNIQGIRGFGKVNSRKLAKKWIETPDQIDEDKKLVIEKNIRLMDLSSGYKISGPEEIECYVRQLKETNDINPDMEAFKSLCEKYEFKSILKDFDKWKNTFDISNLIKFLRDMDF